MPVKAYSTPTATPPADRQEHVLHPLLAALGFAPVRDPLPELARWRRRTATARSKRS